MSQEKIIALFDQQASSYDQKWSELAPLASALHLLTASVLSTLPADARILCVGAGTGTEILSLASRFPGWRFTAVEPSRAMLDVCRRRIEEHGVSARCTFHEGFLDSLAPTTPFDAATAFLVSQFILDRTARAGFFQTIAERLRPEGIVISSDLAADLTSPEHESLLSVWFRVMRGNDLPPEEVERMREGYRRDVAVLPPQDVRDVIVRGGFRPPVLFYQAGLIHAWYTTRPPQAAI